MSELSRALRDMAESPHYAVRRQTLKDAADALESVARMARVAAACDSIHKYLHGRQAADGSIQLSAAEAEKILDLLELKTPTQN